MTDYQKKITPVIEPVKLSSTFINTLQLFIEKERKVLIIQNPTVGNFDGELITNIIGDEDDKEKRRVEILIENQKKYAECQKSPYIELAFLYASEDGLNASLLLFRDRFKKAPRNSDYLENDDEFITKDNPSTQKMIFTGLVITVSLEKDTTKLVFTLCCSHIAICFPSIWFGQKGA